MSEFDGREQADEQAAGPKIDDSEARCENGAPSALHKIVSPRAMRDTVIVIAAMLAIVTASVLWGKANPITFFLYSNEGSTYAHGTVTKVVSEDLKKDVKSPRLLGDQVLEVHVDDGPWAGRTEQIRNSLTPTMNVLGKEGLGVTLRIDQGQEGTEPLFMVFNYDRTVPSAIICVIFGLLMVGVGRSKGLRSLVGLAFAIALVATFMLPAIYRGLSPIAVGVATALLITCGCMALLNGLTTKTLVSVLSAAAGVVVSVAFYLLFTWLLNLSGYNTSGADELLLVEASTGLQIGQVLFAGVLISSLGAVIDMCMSVASPLFEIKRVRPDVDARQIFSSGMEIGRDMIGTMCQTLILAFVGSATGELLLQVSYGTQLVALISSDYMAVEVLQSFAGGAAVILCVPATALVAAWFLTRGEHAAQG